MVRDSSESRAGQAAAVEEVEVGESAEVDRVGGKGVAAFADAVANQVQLPGRKETTLPLTITTK